MIDAVWWDADPRVDVVLAERPLPTRLKTDETWEGWTPAADLAHASDVELLGRVLVTGVKKPVRSRRNIDVPPRGFIAGPGWR